MAAALFLHRAGHGVTLFEQFDAPQPVGSGLLIQPSGQAALKALGLLNPVCEKAARVTGLHGINVVNGKRALDVDYAHLGAGTMALGIHRASLFAILHDAVRAADIPVQTRRVLTAISATDRGPAPQFERGSEAPFDVMVNATGAHSLLSGGTIMTLPFAALWTTVDRPANSAVAQVSLDQRYWGAAKMAGIMPIGINPASGLPGAALFWSVKPDAVEALRRRGIAAWRSEFLDLWPDAAAFVEQVQEFDALTLAVYRHRTGKPTGGRGIFHLGDAWHCTSPQLGQGANMALIDAAALSTSIELASTLPEAARIYRNLRSDHVALYQFLSRVFTPLYQSDSQLLPRIRDLVIHNLARRPGVRWLVAKVVSGSFGNNA